MTISVKCEISDADAMRVFAGKLATFLKADDVIILTGPLGAGKTTLTQGLAQALHVGGAVTSPTFVIARVHPSQVGGPALVHVDAYRLQSADDLETLDLDAHAPYILVMEWGEPFAKFLSDSWLTVTITRPSEVIDELDPAGGVREVEVTAHGPRWVNVDLQGVLL